MGYEPIYIAGSDRSGTTLMFSLLASHPNISMVRRTNMWRYFHNRYGDLGRPGNLERCLNDMARYNRMRHLKPDVERIRREFKQGEPTYGHLFALFHQHNAERNGKARWGDKSLHTENYADRVIVEFPEAKIIHMIRDPRDRYASVRKRHGKDTPRLGASTGRWLLSTKLAMRNQEKYPNNYLVIRFEDLASRPEETMRKVCAFIHEEFSPALLAAEGGGNSSFDKIEPGVISTRPIGRYRQVLTNSETKFIQIFAGSSMESLGYPFETIRLSTNEWFRFYSRILPVHLVRMAGWLMLTRIMILRGIRVPKFRLLDDSAISSGVQDGLSNEIT